MARRSSGIPSYYRTHPDALVRRFAEVHSQFLNDILGLSHFASFCASAGRYRGPAFSGFSSELKLRGQYAVITALSTLLEKQNRELALLMSQLNSHIEIKLSQLKGDLLYRLKVFWIDIFRVRFRRPLLWQRIKQVQAIRNCIVHCDGYVASASDCQSLTRLAVQTKGLSLTGGQLRMTFAFCNRATRYVAQFCDELADAIQPKIISRLQQRTKRTKLRTKGA